MQRNSRTTPRAIAVLSCALALGACQPSGSFRSGVHRPAPTLPEPAEGEIPARPASFRAGGLREAFPGVWVNAEARIVELDATVPIVTDDPEAPLVYLELVGCSPDTREHESLVMVPARPSHVHAALLLIGLEPGAPGAWRVVEGRPDYVSPTGDAVRVEFVLERDGQTVVEPAHEWVRHARTGEGFPDRDFVFAGSRFVTRAGVERYDADGTGCLIGLTTFGSEVVAWPEVISPESAVDEPVWVAHNERVPAFGTGVRVRIRPAE